MIGELRKGPARSRSVIAPTRGGPTSKGRIGTELGRVLLVATSTRPRVNLVHLPERRPVVGQRSGSYFDLCRPTLSGINCRSRGSFSSALRHNGTYPQHLLSSSPEDARPDRDCTHNESAPDKVARGSSQGAIVVLYLGSSALPLKPNHHDIRSRVSRATRPQGYRR